MRSRPIPREEMVTMVRNRGGAPSVKEPFIAIPLRYSVPSLGSLPRVTMGAIT